MFVQELAILQVGAMKAIYYSNNLVNLLFRAFSFQGSLMWHKL
jgi:hypothetical protein